MSSNDWIVRSDGPSWGSAPDGDMLIWRQHGTANERSAGHCATISRSCRSALEVKYSGSQVMASLLT